MSSQASNEDQLNESLLRLENELQSRTLRLAKLDSDIEYKEDILDGINESITTNRTVHNSEVRKFTATKERMVDEIEVLKSQHQMLSSQAIETEQYVNQQRDLIRREWVKVRQEQNRTKGRNGTSVFDDLT